LCLFLVIAPVALMLRFRGADRLHFRLDRPRGQELLDRTRAARAGAGFDDEPVLKGFIDMSIAGELWRYLRARKKLWLAPIIMIMVAFGGLVVLAQGTAVAPFIYTLF
jgi:hypothetical protein